MDATTDTTSPDRPALLADLNDLLQLDRDALPVYAAALAALPDGDDRDAVAAFRADHQRHVEELTAAIRALGGMPAPLPHMPTGLLKLGVQVAAAPGGPRAVLLAFRGNERQVRDKYARLAARRAALPGPPGIADLLARNAADEERHYAWVSQRLDGLGAGEDTPLGRAAAAFARIHAANADALEAVGHAAMEGAARWLPATRGR